MLKICGYIEADELKCLMPIKKNSKTCKRHTCECGNGKPSFLLYCRKCLNNKS